MFEENLILTLVWAHLGLIFGNLGAGKKIVFTTFCSYVHRKFILFLQKTGSKPLFFNHALINIHGGPQRCPIGRQKEHTHTWNELKGNVDDVMSSFLFIVFVYVPGVMCLPKH